jgi:hypothetical protein
MRLKKTACNDGAMVAGCQGRRTLVVGGGVEERSNLASCRGCVRRRVDVLLSLCGSLR